MMKYAFAVGVLVAAIPAAQAGLADRNVTVDYLSPYYGPDPVSTEDRQVGSSVLIGNYDLFGIPADVFIDDDTIRIDQFGGADTFDSLSFNGLRFTFSSVADDFIGGVAFAGSHNATLDASRITHDGNHVWIDWADMPFDESTVVELGLTFTTEDPSVIPEPAAAVGLVALMLIARRRRSTTAVRSV